MTNTTTGCQQPRSYQQERETERGKSPRTPLKEKGLEKEASTPRVRARAEREILPPVIDVRPPPSPELLLAFAHTRLGFFDDAFTLEWLRVAQDEFQWIHPKTGRPILHWPQYFREWRLNRRFFETLRDPKRLMSPAMLKSAEADEAEARRRAEEDARRVTASAASESWALCAERCANFCDGRCSCGAKTPPRFWNTLYKLRDYPELQKTLRAIRRHRVRQKFFSALKIKAETYRRRFFDLTRILEITI